MRRKRRARALVGERPFRAVTLTPKGRTMTATWLRARRLPEDLRWAAMQRALTGATRDSRPIVIIGTAENAPTTTQILDPATALQTINDMTPRPWLQPSCRRRAAPRHSTGCSIH